MQIWSHSCVYCTCVKRRWKIENKSARHFLYLEHDGILELGLFLIEMLRIWKNVISNALRIKKKELFLESFKMKHQILQSTFYSKKVEKWMKHNHVRNFM